MRPGHAVSQPLRDVGNFAGNDKDWVAPADKVFALSPHTVILTREGLKWHKVMATGPDGYITDNRGPWPSIVGGRSSTRWMLRVSIRKKFRDIPLSRFLSSFVTEVYLYSRR